MVKNQNIKFVTIGQERYDALMAKYSVFLDAMSDPDLEPVSPYPPLAQEYVDNLELIREVSRELQKKKNEDINKAAQAAKEAAETAKKPTEEPQEEKTE